MVWAAATMMAARMWRKTGALGLPVPHRWVAADPEWVRRVGRAGLWLGRPTPVPERQALNNTNLETLWACRCSGSWQTRVFCQWFLRVIVYSMRQELTDLDPSPRSLRRPGPPH